ncbi:histidine phosphatase family protein, partial [Kineococcus glutinatus]|uniref:histidine phosphatase family protein n=1 Tax=Kineococcus glutinatus TaxID=1070872 RepID=UPI0031E9083A
MPTLLLVRHGRSTANTAGVLAGWTPDVHLDEVGRGQVAALGRRMAALPLARVACSPLERCLE